MAYLRNHLLMTAHWKPGNVAEEHAQTGIRVDVSAMPADAALTAAQGNVQAFWTAAGSLIPRSYVLEFLRFAMIGTDGKYLPGSVAIDKTYAAGAIFGSGTAGQEHPLQVASVATLLTAVPRGQGSRGRLYLPPFAPPVGSDYRWTAATVDARATLLGTLLAQLGTSLGGPPCVMSKGTKAGGAGLTQTVVNVKIGRRPDVQRRRARQLPELYGATKPVVV